MRAIAATVLTQEQRDSLAGIDDNPQCINAIDVFGLQTHYGCKSINNGGTYTTNAIESLNSVIRKAIKKRKLFPTDDSAKKVIYLAIQAASKKWTMPIRNWKAALNRFMIEFEDRLTDYI